MATEVCPKCGSDQIREEPTARGVRVVCSSCAHSWHHQKGIEAGPNPARPVFNKPTPDQLRHRFLYHAPKGDQAGRYEQVRTAIWEAGVACVDQTPCSPEQTRALNALDEAMFLFNAAIARNE